jgi:hypothetical protein
VWCVKSIYLNLFASIGIWQRASCFHLMFFVLNTDKQACFCVPLSLVSVSFSQCFTLRVLKWRQNMYFTYICVYIYICMCIYIYDANHCLIFVHIQIHHFLLSGVFFWDSWILVITLFAHRNILEFCLIFLIKCNQPDYSISLY